MALSVAGTKAVALVTMTIITLTFSMMPLYVRRLLKGKFKGRKAQVALSACLCFGCGVLLATVFLHLIPEARMMTEQAIERRFIPYTTYPVGELIVCVGFFIIYIIEDFVHMFSKHNAHSGHHSHLPAGQELHSTESSDSVDKATQSPKKSPKFASDDFADAAEVENLFDDEEKQVSQSSVSESPKDGMPTVKAVIFVVAFSFHSIMEGLALGLVHSNKDVWFLFAALLAHKVVIAFCMAMELLEVGVNLAGFLSSMIIFSLASPLGGLLGTLIVSFANKDSPAGFVTETVLQGISAGTILYVTFCEVLERERSKSDGATIKMVSLIIGFCAMALLQIFDDEAIIQQQNPVHLNITTTN